MVVYDPIWNQDMATDLNISGWQNLDLKIGHIGFQCFKPRSDVPFLTSCILQSPDLSQPEAARSYMVNTGVE